MDAVWSDSNIKLKLRLKCHIQSDDLKKSHAAHVLLLGHVHTDSNVTSFVGIDGANTGSSNQKLNIVATLCFCTTSSHKLLRWLIQITQTHVLLLFPSQYVWWKIKWLPSWWLELSRLVCVYYELLCSVLASDEALNALYVAPATALASHISLCHCSLCCVDAELFQSESLLTL